MNKYAGWQAVYMSFFSGDLYRDVARNWKGVGYLYLMCVVFAVWLVISVCAQVKLGEVVATNIQPIVDKWPTLKIHNGEFSIDKPCPYVIDIANTGVFLLDFDTRDNAQLPDGKMGILVGKTSIHQITTADQQIVSLTDIAKSSSTPLPDMTFDRQAVQNFVETIKRWFGVAMFCILGPATLVGCMIQTLIYAGIGMIVSSVMNVGLTYGQVVRMASVALTPGLVLEGIIRATGHQFNFWPLISIVLAIVFVVVGVRANLEAPTPAVTS